MNTITPDIKPRAAFNDLLNTIFLYNKTNVL